MSIKEASNNIDDKKVMAQTYTGEEPDTSTVDDDEYEDADCMDYEDDYELLVDCETCKHADNACNICEECESSNYSFYEEADV